MRRIIVLIATALLLTVTAATPAEAALPVQGAKYSDKTSVNDVHGNFFYSGAVKLKVKGNSNRKFAKIFATFTCSDGSTPAYAA